MNAKPTATFAFAVGVRNSNGAGLVLDCLYPAPVMHPTDTAAEAIAALAEGVTQLDDAKIAALRNSAPELVPEALISGQANSATAQELIAIRLGADSEITSTEEAYLKLHLLSHRLALPNTLNLGGIFAHLPNLAWTSAGPIEVSELTAALLNARAEGLNLEVFAVDKFPKMVNYVVPPGVRIADASRIRLGAYLGEGTTVMHEGFVNFNAAALGPNMVEGRISQGVTIGAGTDLGGSSSTQGTLSGGGEIVISIGEQCLVGANAGTGIPLGDRCTIEAGLYITAGTPVTVVDEHGEEVRRVKARELAGHSDMLFIRSSLNGQVMCRTNRKAIELNDILHQHN
ncbi:MAG: 2,3,4,5-tetrahydropyridine-2,6-dicarboxylate N-succinyltransferase [Proteobacteria bacterium]|nr:2,3,4,5-tetrahydropyridine-2,6-dicarboxylate N-succinyltransferase [Pseudomonadota bacterium]